MINQKDNYKNYIIVGFFITVSGLLLGILIMLLGQEESLFSKKINIKTIVTNANGIRPGSSVYLKGIKIGSVSNVHFEDIDKISINLMIDYSYSKWIKENSKVTLKTQGVLGDKYIEIAGGTTPSKSIENNGLLLTDESGQFDRIVTKSEDVLIIATNAILKFDKLLAVIPPNRVKNIIHNFDELLLKLSVLTENLNKSKLIKTLEKTNTSIKNISKQIEKGPGTAHSLIYDSTLHEDLQQLFGGAKRNQVLKYFIRESIKQSDRINEKN